MRTWFLFLLLALPGIAFAKKETRPVLDGDGAAHSVVLCQTSLAELQTRLGTPTRDGILHSNRIVSWVTEWEPLARYLAVMVNKDGLVVDLYWNVPTEIPWNPSDQCVGH
jgi:hypothetical protein